MTVLLDNIANDGALNEGDNVFTPWRTSWARRGTISIGSAPPNAFRGGEGDDVLLGHGNDDVILGDAGDDFLNGDAGNDLIDGNAGIDTLFGSEGNDSLGVRDGAQDKTVDGGAGTNTCSVDPVDPRVTCEVGA
jgi:Ca2+-binding RTX toxin-like protein